MVLDPIKHVLRVFFNGFKNIPEKACVLGVRTKVQIVRGRYKHTRNKLCLIRIIYIRNTNEECFIAHARDALSVF